MMIHILKHSLKSNFTHKFNFYKSLEKRRVQTVSLKYNRNSGIELFVDSYDNEKQFRFMRFQQKQLIHTCKKPLFIIAFQ